MKRIAKRTALSAIRKYREGLKLMITEELTLSLLLSQYIRNKIK